MVTDDALGEYPLSTGGAPPTYREITVRGCHLTERAPGMLRVGMGIPGRSGPGSISPAGWHPGSDSRSASPQPFGLRARAVSPQVHKAFWYAVQRLWGVAGCPPGTWSEARHNRRDRQELAHVLLAMTPLSVPGLCPRRHPAPPATVCLFSPTRHPHVSGGEGAGGSGAITDPTPVPPEPGESRPTHRVGIFNSKRSDAQAL